MKKTECLLFDRRQRLKSYGGIHLAVITEGGIAKHPAVPKHV
jgi:hypothetical protein